MGTGFSNPIVGGGGALDYPSIHSPNYVPATSGWTINKDGSAEFSNLTLRGTFMGLNFEITAAGVFFYSGTPAKGTLVFALTTQTGTDAFGNSYLPLMNAGTWSAITGGLLGHFGLDENGNAYWSDSTGANRFWLTTNNVSNFGLTIAFLATNASGALLAALANDGYWFYPDTGSASQGALAAAIVGKTGKTDPIGGNAFPAGQIGPITAIQPGSSPPAAETWHDMTSTLASGWSVISGQVARYKKLADTSLVMVQAGITHTSFSGAIAVWNPPAGYLPSGAQLQPIGGPYYGSSVLGVLISSAGMVTGDAPAGSTNVYLSGIYALD